MKKIIYRLKELNSNVSNKIIFINLLIFIFMCFQDLSFLRPSYEALIFWGAKDSVLIAQGQWWRFFTANFVHFGIIHLWLNLYALKIVGPRIEEVIGGKLFLFIYLLSGIVSVIISSYVHLSVGGGASGAIFGLIGVGLVIESMHQRHLLAFINPHIFFSKKKLKEFVHNRPYLFVALINILIAILINTVFNFFSIQIKIDNAAHLSGLGTGILVFVLVLKIFIQKNNFFTKIKYSSSAALFVFFVIYLMQNLLASSYLETKFFQKAKNSLDHRQAYFLYSQALQINSKNSLAHFERGRLLWLNKEYSEAIKDFRQSLHLSKKTNNKFNDFTLELLKIDPYEARLLRDFLIQEDKKNDFLP